MVNRAFLEKAPLAAARARWLGALEEAGFFEPRVERVPAAQACGRISAVPLVARRPVPHARAAAMDGIALRAADTAAARRDRPLALERDRDFVRVDTGDPLPEGLDAVVMLEELEFLDERTVELRQAAFPGQHVRPVGEDFPEGATIVGAHTLLTPEAVAACLASGNLEVPVIRQPRVGVLLTGSELVPADGPLPPDKYPETNSALFAGYLSRWRAEPVLAPLLKDEDAQIQAAVAQGLNDHDVILINAGTSKGREDLTASIIAHFGEVLVHGVSMHPGHPVVLGIARGKPLVGVPGYPVATWVVLDQFVLPLLERYYGCPLQPRPTLSGTLARQLTSPLGEVEFVRVRLERTADGVRVHPLSGKASALSSLVCADGLVEIPESLNGYAQGESVTVRLLERV